MNLKVRVEFGKSIVRDVSWYDEIGKFHRVFKYQGDYWGSPCQTKSWDNSCDYIISYTKLDSSTMVGLEVPDFDEVFRWQISSQKNCECGAGYDRHFSNVHSYWCPKWEKV